MSDSPDPIVSRGLIEFVLLSVEKRNAEPEAAAEPERVPELQKRANGAGTNFYGL